MNVDHRLTRLAARQYGLLRASQAVDLGCSQRMLEHRARIGRLERLEPGVYRVSGTSETWHQRVLCACWAEDGVAFGRTAAALFGLDGFGPRLVEVVTPRGRRRVNASIRVHESRDLTEVDRSERLGIPLTTIERTIIDLGAVVPSVKVEQALDDALRRGLTTPESVQRRLVQIARRGRPGVGVLRPLLEVRLGTTGPRPGEFERRVRRVIAEAGAPEAHCEYEVRSPTGLLLARVDLAFPPQRVAIECDSDRWHSGRQRRQRDLERQNALILAGWTILRFTWTDLVDRPELIVAQVRAALAVAA